MVNDPARSQFVLCRSFDCLSLSHINGGTHDRAESRGFAGFTPNDATVTAHPSLDTSRDACGALCTVNFMTEIRLLLSDSNICIHPPPPTVIVAILLPKAQKLRQDVTFVFVRDCEQSVVRFVFCCAPKS